MYPFECPELPPSVNHIYNTSRSGGFYKNGSVAAYEKIWMLYVPRKKDPIAVPCALHLTFTMAKPGTLKKRDLDNFLKVTQDLLVASNYLTNDSLIYELHVKKQPGSSDSTTGYFSLLD